MSVEDKLDQLTGQQQSLLRQMDLLNTIMDRDTRAPSKAGIIGQAMPWPNRGDVPDSGRWITALANARSRDAQEQAQGKAMLEGLGFRYSEGDPMVKATLGDTGATGGFVVPNNFVDEIEKQEGYANPYRKVLTVRRVSGMAGIDVPTRSLATSRAIVSAFGATKPNVDLTVAKYTATLYTLARIHDVSNQLLRHSAGAAEADVRSELVNAVALGEAYYTMNGSGTSEPYGLIPALTAITGYTSTFSAPSTTTVAGSLASAIATTLGPLASRNRTTGLTAVVGPTTYATAIAEGSDQAGFWFSGFAGFGGAASLPGWPSGTLAVFGVPIIVDPVITDKRLIVGDFSELTMYIGQDFRIDVSDTAGTRWDTNETGFRGEEEFGLNALPAVYSGAFQQILTAVP